MLKLACVYHITLAADGIATIYTAFGDGGASVF